VRSQKDDWGPALGGETPDPSESSPAPKKGTLGFLVREFHDRVTMSLPMSLNSQVNGPALSKAFRTLLDTGRSHEHIQSMIKQFVDDISRKPLTNGIPAWRAFLSRLDSLDEKVNNANPSYDYDGFKIDPRLNGNSDD
jgi:hypothetical protein